MSLILGDYHQNIKCESFIDPETNRVRVRPLNHQGLPTNMVIECSRAIRTEHPVGTIFIAETLKVCQKPGGRIYLRAKNQDIRKL